MTHPHKYFCRHEETSSQHQHKMHPQQPRKIHSTCYLKHVRINASCSLVIEHIIPETADELT